MEPIKVRILRILDFGEIISIVGTEIASRKSVIIQMDYQPVSALWNVFKATTFSGHSMEYEAERVTLSLELECDDEAEREELSPLTHPPKSRQ